MSASGYFLASPLRQDDPSRWLWDEQDSVQRSIYIILLFLFALSHAVRQRDSALPHHVQELRLRLERNGAGDWGH